MSRPAEQFITPADYLALERQAETKSEYLNGHIYAMSGASRSHNYWYWVTWTPEGKLLSTAGDDPASARRGFVVSKQNDGLWVFRANQPELAEFAKSGTLAKPVKAEKAGPGGIDLKGADEATLLAYQVSCDELAVLVIDERIWVFVPASAELAEFGQRADQMKRHALTRRGVEVQTVEHR